MEVLGFQVRAPDGGTTAYCTHGITKEELWVPMHVDTLDDDALEFLLESTTLPWEYFRGVYMGLDIRPENLHPSDEH